MIRAARAVFLPIALVVVIAAVCGIATAQVAESPAVRRPPRNVFRAGVFQSRPTGDLDTGFGSLKIHLEAEDSRGYTISYERKMGRIVGLDFNLSRVKYNLAREVKRPANPFSRAGGEPVVNGLPSNEGAVPHDRRMVSLTIGPLFHPLGPRTIDWYVGLVPSVVYFPVDQGVDEGVHLENDRSYVELGLSARSGVDIAFGGTGRARLNLDVQYLRASAGEDERGNRFRIDPINVGARIAVHY